MKNYYVYIIECSDKSFYVGVTNDVINRFSEHENNDDHKAYTFNRKPLKLVFFTSFSNIEMAIDKEKQIKKWSRNKKIALINGDYENLPNLSKKAF